MQGRAQQFTTFWARAPWKKRFINPAARRTDAGRHNGSQPSDWNGPKPGRSLCQFLQFFLNNIQRILFVTQVNALDYFQPNQRTSRRSVGAVANNAISETISVLDPTFRKRPAVNREAEED
jgi:hypothetical protein